MPNTTTETAETMLSLAQMQKALPEQLRAIALRSLNRYYSQAADRMASAMDAHAQGDVASMRKFVEAAKTSYKRALEDEHGQVLRVRQTAKTVRESAVSK